MYYENHKENTVTVSKINPCTDGPTQFKCVVQRSTAEQTQAGTDALGETGELTLGRLHSVC